MVFSLVVNIEFIRLISSSFSLKPFPGQGPMIFSAEAKKSVCCPTGEKSDRPPPSFCDPIHSTLAGLASMYQKKKSLPKNSPARST